MMLRDNREIVIVGAGITGLTLAYELAKQNNFNVTIIEKEKRIGGLAKSFKYNGFSFDIGPHRFDVSNDKILRFIKEVMRDDTVSIDRHSGVYFLKKYYTWPFCPAALYRLPIHITAKSAFDLLFKNKKMLRQGNFESYIVRNYGPTLYRVFFKDYTEKFLGMRSEKVHSDWSKLSMKRAVSDESVACRNLLDILKLILYPFSIQNEFLYPKGGIGDFCERISEKVKELGGNILVDAKISDIKTSENRIDSVKVNDITLKPHFLIWTGALKDLCRAINFSDYGINYLSLLIYNFELNKKQVDSHYQWCYYGDKNLILCRLSNPSLFGSNCAPEGKVGICVEVTCREGAERWRSPWSLLSQMKKDLVKVGVIKHEEDIENVHVERIADAYPIYDIDYTHRLSALKSKLKRFENLLLAGRTGLFWYNNMHDSIKNGLQLARHFVENS